MPSGTFRWSRILAQTMLILRFIRALEEFRGGIVIYGVRNFLCKNPSAQGFWA